MPHVKNTCCSSGKESSSSRWWWTDTEVRNLFLNIRRHICQQQVLQNTLSYAYLKLTVWSGSNTFTNAGTLVGVLMCVRIKRRTTAHQFNMATAVSPALSVNFSHAAQFQLCPFCLIWKDWGNHVNEAAAAILPYFLALADGGHHIKDLARH